MFLKIRTHCMNQPWRTEDTDCRNRHCALPAPFNHRPAELREHQAPYCSLWLAAKSADLFTSTNRFNFTNGFNSQSTSVYFHSSWFFFFKLCGLKHLFHKPVKLAWTSEFSLKWSYSCVLLLMHYLGVNRWHSLNFNNENTLVSFNPFYRWCLRWNFLWWKKKGNNLSFNAQT